MDDEAFQRTVAKLAKIREKSDIKIRPTPHLKPMFTTLAGTEKEFKLRYYQVQMVLHLMSMHRFVCGDDTGLGKTVETVAALCYLWDRNPDLKAIVLTKKSALEQWVEEGFETFTTGVTIILSSGTPKQRKAAYEKYVASTGPTVLISGYRSMVRDFETIQDWQPGVLVLDEATVVKNPTAQVSQVIRHLSSQSKRCWGLTATLIKNNLVEGFGIYRVVVPGLFTHSKSAFEADYCVIQMQPIGRGRKVPVVVGVRKRDVIRFREKISPYYLGRPKHEVASELPPLTSRTIRMGMSHAQHIKYQEALSGILEHGDGEDREVTPLTAITYCQEIVNHPDLIDIEGDSEKLDRLGDILTDGGDFTGEKVIIFTRFEKMVTIAVDYLDKKGVKCVRITGKENIAQRRAAQKAFQDVDSDVKVAWITMAGGDAINLQAAKCMIFYDTPFSAGDYLQILGRMIRIGSIHDRVYAIHLVCRDTVDERVMEIMSKKMELLEAVLGKRLKGEDDDEDYEIASQGDVSALFEALQNDAFKVLGA